MHAAQWQKYVASPHCNTLQHTETHCNTLQHTETQCNTLQHTAAHQCSKHSGKGMGWVVTVTPCNALQHTSAASTVAEV